jgi:hypothetical protein
MKKGASKWQLSTTSIAHGIIELTEWDEWGNNLGSYGAILHPERNVRFYSGSALIDTAYIPHYVRDQVYRLFDKQAGMAAEPLQHLYPIVWERKGKGRKWYLLACASVDNVQQCYVVLVTAITSYRYHVTMGDGEFQVYDWHGNRLRGNNGHIPEYVWLQVLQHLSREPRHVEGKESRVVDCSTGIKDELYTTFYICPYDCGETSIRNGDRYCSNCGKPLAWESSR